MQTASAPPERLTLERLSTPIGTALVVTDEAGFLRAYNWTDYEPRVLGWIARHYPKARFGEGRADGAVRAALQAYFEGDAGALGGVPWRASGTAFQLLVWQTLCSIPPGQTLSYAGLAARIGRPTAVRAVGLANGANPVPLVAPCHRVIGSNGALTGYGGGLARKTWLLEHEKARFTAAAAA